MSAEYKDENFSIVWKEEEGTIFIKTWGVHKKETAELFRQRFNKIIEEIPAGKDFNILVDDAKNIKTDHDARRIYTSFTKELVDKRPNINVKMAIVGANIFVSAVVNFLMTPIASKKNIKLKSFKTVEQGMEWIKGK